MKYLMVSLSVLANSCIMLYAEVSTEFYILMEKASAGDAETQYDIAVSYDHGDFGVEKDTKESFKWYLKAAKQGYIKAQCCVGWAFKNGEGVKKDTKQAFEWYLKAAEQGDAWAQYRVGEAYAKGEGVNKDLKKAVEWISKVDLNDLRPINLSWDYTMLHDKYDMDKYYSPSVAFIKLKEKASTGDTEALYHVALSYDHGDGVKKNTKTAFKWYLKAAERGHAKAQFKVGESYSGNGDYVDDYNDGYLGYFGLYGDSDTGINNDSGDDDFYHRDAAKAFKWFLKAAEQNLAEAQYNVGVIYEYAEGSEQDLQKAYEWYLKAAKQGHAHAQYDLAWAYENGRGVKKDLKKAFQWHLKAAEQGYSEARYKVGEAYFIGKGVEKDAKQSFKWYLKESWESKWGGANLFISRAYDQVKLSEQDPQKAFAWYLEAAELEEYGGYREAQYDVAVSYANGKGVEQDLQKAFEWYLKATDTMYGEVNAKAQYAVGKSYIKGEGVEKDLKKAAKWISKVNRKQVPEADKVWRQYKLEKYHEPSSESTELKEKASTDKDVQHEDGEENAKKAFAWHLKTAEQGHAEAQYKVGSLYEKGEGVEQDARKAFTWHLKAAEQKEVNGSGVSCLSIAEAYYSGNGVKPNSEKAREWILKNFYWEPSKNALENIIIGDTYLNEGRPKVAFAYYIAAFNEAIKESRYIKSGMFIDRSYDLARRLDKEPKEAFEWYLEAAELDEHGDCLQNQYDLGASYASGYGVEKDLMKAFKWYLKAAEKKHPTAILYIGKAYANGEGVEKDLKKAAEWISKVDEKIMPEAAEIWEEFELEKFR